MTDLEIEIKLIDAYWGFYDRMYNERIAPLVWMVKNGEITWQPPKHNDPALFGLESKEAINMRIRYLKGLKSPLELNLSDKKGQFLRGEDKFCYRTMNYLQDAINKLDKAIHFLKARLKGEVVNQQFDLEAIKRVPMNTICRINNNNFFQTNPFRAEKEPSNSLFYYRAQNRWTDFGSGRSGDVVDVVMAKENCSFKDACKLLNTML